MSSKLQFPYGEFDRENPNLDLLADFFELCAYFSKEKISIPENFGDKFQILQDGEDSDIGVKLDSEDGPLDEVVRKIADRRSDLENAYPFVIDTNNITLRYKGEDLSHGQCAYILSLVLSNIYGTSKIFESSELHPTKQEATILRRYFEYFSVAALAAETNGHAWQFGSPRIGERSFKKKLEKVCRFLGLKYRPVEFAPSNQKDSGIDVLSARPYRDNLPGFIFAIGQVSTSKYWRSRRILGNDEFKEIWLSRDVPMGSSLIYHVIPFARSRHDFFHDCVIYNRILHRTRLPFLVNKAAHLNRIECITMSSDGGVLVEAYEELSKAIEWVKSYCRRGY